MDLATIAGLVIVSVLLAASVVLGGDPILFVDVNSMLIVGGGTIGAGLIRNPLSTFLTTIRVLGKAFSTKVPQTEALLARVIELSNHARREGILALEDEAIDYPFLNQGVSMCVDGSTEEDIRVTLGTDLRTMVQRHKQGQEILKGLGQAAPAFGMIGTLVGLVQMLAKLDDPSQIGPAMALALLTTLYGALLSNCFFLPLADKLKLRSQQEQLNMMLCIEAVIGLTKGINPRTLEQQLGAFLAPSLRRSADNEASPTPGQTAPVEEAA